MDLGKEWKALRIHFNKSFKSNFHVSIASVDTNNNPTVTPIGSLFLNHNQSGFYFEKYPAKLPEAAKNNLNICVLAVNSSKWFWLKSLFSGSFKSPPAIKLYGQLGQRREAKQQELSRLKRRMKITSGLKGNTYLWGNMKFIREIEFSRAEKINLGGMTNS